MEHEAYKQLTWDERVERGFKFIFDLCALYNGFGLFH
jgi:hypothetical protein